MGLKIRFGDARPPAESPLAYTTSKGGCKIMIHGS
jgi:hypothetical protein